MSRPALRPRADHKATAAELRSCPGKWLRVGVFRAPYTASTTAYAIRTAYRRPMYAPAGSFEARTVPYGDGTAVQARYVGGAS